MSSQSSMIIAVANATSKISSKVKIPKVGAPNVKPASKGGSDLGRETWSLLQRVVFSQRPRWMAVIREYDLVPPHWIALQALEEPKPMGELAKLLACDNSNV